MLAEKQGKSRANACYTASRQFSRCWRDFASRWQNSAARDRCIWAAVLPILAAQAYGVVRAEARREGRAISLEQRMIMDDPSAKNAGGVAFSQPHGSNFGDFNGDGVPDFVVGKRYWSHRDDYLDPDPYGSAVLLYRYKTVGNPKAPGGAEFVPELIHNRSGTGSDVYPVDLNKDGRLDVITAPRFGTFIFWNNVKR